MNEIDCYACDGFGMRSKPVHWLIRALEFLGMIGPYRPIENCNNCCGTSIIRAPYETDDERDIGIARKCIDELENKKTPLLRGEALEARLNKWEED